MRLPRASYNVQLTGKDVVAPSLQLSHSPRGVRGRAYDAATDIEFKDGEANGTIGGLAVKLKIKTEGDTVKAEGGFAGRPVTVSYSPSELTVYINDCTWRLKNDSEGSYVGRRSCDRAFLGDTSVSLPEVFQELSPAEQVTLLLLSLS
ncbi:hypothetical protein [Hyalangium gracile]|uniref:hypothetical protein n=1 Tax=Hyalangium gracile TaxID=394092 RepID=UPI001CCA29A9|nr:hypothetical protein [Hyalangium gracile]